MVKFTDGFKFPTFEGDYIELMPFYLYSGRSYTIIQQGKLSCFVGMTFRYYDVPEILIKYLTPNLQKDLLESIFDYITNPDGTINYSNTDKYNFPESELNNFLTIQLT